MKQISKLLCYLNLHNWEINKIVEKGKGGGKYVLKNFHRYCEHCDKGQRLQRPEEYHPSKYIWVDIED